jgi:hypothetical protein
MAQARDYTGIKVNGRTCVGMTGRKDPSGHQLWTIRCDNCGWETHSASSGVCTWIRRKPGCQKCNHGMGQDVPLGTRCQLLVSTGAAQSVIGKPGQRVVPAKCTRCGKAGVFRKANFLSGRANCPCNTQTLDGQWKTPEGSMLCSARVRAKKAGRDCTIGLEHIVIPTHCPLLGIEIIPGATREQLPHAPSLDRIDSSLGYVPGNVWVISHRANRIKTDATIEELEMVLEGLKKRAG